MKISGILMVAGLGLCVFGVAFFGIGPKLGINAPAPYAAMIIGSGILLVGLNGVFTARTTEGVSRTKITHYGWSARFRGAGFALLGLVILAGSALDLAGKRETFLASTAGGGWIALTLGLFGLIGSGILIVEKPQGSKLLALPGKIAGGLLFCISLLLVTIGAVVIAVPQTVQTILNQLRAR